MNRKQQKSLGMSFMKIFKTSPDFPMVLKLMVTDLKKSAPLFFEKMLEMTNIHDTLFNEEITDSTRPALEYLYKSYSKTAISKTIKSINELKESETEETWTTFILQQAKDSLTIETELFCNEEDHINLLKLLLIDHYFPAYLPKKVMNAVHDLIMQRDEIVEDFGSEYRNIEKHHGHIIDHFDGTNDGLLFSKLASNSSVENDIVLEPYFQKSQFANFDEYTSSENSYWSKLNKSSLISVDMAGMMTMSENIGTFLIFFYNEHYPIFLKFKKDKEKLQHQIDQNCSIVSDLKSSIKQVEKKNKDLSNQHKTHQSIITKLKNENSTIKQQHIKSDAQQTINRQQDLIDALLLKIDELEAPSEQVQTEIEIVVDETIVAIDTIVTARKKVLVIGGRASKTKLESTYADATEIVHILPGEYRRLTGTPPSADIVLFDTKCNSHSMYYLAKQLYKGKLYHI